jgi:dolichol-phosphate mannosyltransferase
VPGDVLVVLPTYNEIENVAEISRAILQNASRLLIVDDNSPDGTGSRADELARSEARVSVLHRPEKQGLGPAYAAGFAVAFAEGADVVCEIDADFSHDPADLPRLIAAVEGGADLAIGSRYVPGGGVADWPLHRRLLSRLGNVYASAVLGVPVRDMTAGFRAFRTDALRRLHPETCEASGYGFQVEMAWRAARAGMAVQEIPITFRDRVRGTSKMDWRIAAEAMWLITKWGLGRVRGRLSGAHERSG